MWPISHHFFLLTEKALEPIENEKNQEDFIYSQFCQRAPPQSQTPKQYIFLSCFPRPENKNDSTLETEFGNGVNCVEN